MKLLIRVPIEVNNKDHRRCAHVCQFAEKQRGIYNCTLFGEVIDTGDDDDIGYGFQRVRACLDGAFEPRIPRGDSHD